MKRVIQSKTRTKTGVVLVFIALVLALGITCPSSAFALDETDTDALAGAPVAQEQTNTLQDTKAASNDALEESEVPSGSAVEPNLDTAIEFEKNRPEETTGVAAENYRGVLVSSALIPSDQLVTVEYWSYTDASPDQEVIVHTKTALLSDMFDPTFDPNKDDDPLNDWMGYRFTGWWDEGWAEPYSISAPQEEAVTLGELAHRAEWDGVSPIRVYADYLLRYIEVTYHTNGYADEYPMETVQLIAWIEAPYQDIYWPGYEFLGIMDEYCNYIDETMTCGDILQGLAEMSFTDPADIREYLHSVETLDLYFDWHYRQYEVCFISPESTYVQSYGYYEDLVLAVPEKIDGYEFVGWFTEPNGQGTQVIDKMKYAMFEQDEMVMSRNLYAYYIPKA